MQDGRVSQVASAGGHHLHGRLHALLHTLLRRHQGSFRLRLPGGGSGDVHLSATIRGDAGWGRRVWRAGSPVGGSRPSVVRAWRPNRRRDIVNGKDDSVTRPRPSRPSLRLARRDETGARHWQALADDLAAWIEADSFTDEHDPWAEPEQEPETGRRARNPTKGDV